MKFSFEKKPSAPSISKLTKVAALSIALGFGSGKEASAQKVQEVPISHEIVLRSEEGSLDFFEIFVEESKKDFAGLEKLSEEYRKLAAELQEKSAIYSGRQAMMVEYINSALDHMKNNGEKIKLPTDFSFDEIEEEMEDFYAVARSMHKKDHLLPEDLAKKFVEYTKLSTAREDLEAAYNIVGMIEREDAETKERLSKKVRVRLGRGRDDVSIPKENIEAIVSPTSFVSQSDLVKILSMYFEILMLEDDLDENESNQDDHESRIEFFLQSFHDAGIEIVHTSKNTKSLPTP